MKKLVVLGGGESGRGVALLAKHHGFGVLLSDAGKLSAAAIAELEEAGIDYEHQGHSEDLLAAVDLVVKSPGIPWEAGLVASAKTSGIPVVGEMEFCAPYVRSKLIGITGSNGKTTTTLLLYHLLQKSGFSVRAGGNLGTSLARMLVTESQPDWYVLELSSFQLEDIASFHVDIGTVLNLSPDHLDRYAGSMRAYADAKYRLKSTQKAGALWLQASDSFTQSFAPSAADGVRQVELPPAYTSGEVRCGEVSYNLQGTVLSGPHNAANATVALLIAQELGAKPEVLAKALASFKNADHRLEYAGEIAGVLFINDSKATNTDAALKALQSYENPIVWIMGGQDKGNVYDSLLDTVRQNVKAIVALGVDNTKIRETFKSLVPAFASVNNMPAAIAGAIKFAEKGDVVLLSPACASFDLFRNYIDRGDQFKKAVSQQPEFSKKPAV